MRIRDLRDDDLDACVALNAASIPAVGEADRAKLERIRSMSRFALIAEGDSGEVVGFSLNLPPGTEYPSVNYRWFGERYDDFVYLDRIVVAESARNGGVGAALYAELERRMAGTPLLCCEVNLRPRNDGSLRFHARLGFEEVGQLETDYGVLVSLLAKRSSSS